MHLLDRDNMGHYNGTDGIKGTKSDRPILGATGIWSSPAYWNNRLFYQPRMRR